MSTINLVYLAKPVRGGWPTYTAHLVYGLQSAGHDVQLWRLGKRTEGTLRPFGRGLWYSNASLGFLEELARRENLHITAAEAKQSQLVGCLLRSGATITIHDPTELKGGMKEALREGSKPVVAVRAPVLYELQVHSGIGSRLVVHPYVRMPNNTEVPLTHNAVAFSRLDWDKGTHHIVAHNRDHGPERAVYMWGAENRLYTHHKLMVIDPEWRRYYRGQWPTGDLWEAVRIARQARYAVDLSSIKGDGGGTQYTFLEALDGDAILILNREWLVKGHAVDEMYDFANFVDPEKLLMPICGIALKKDPSELFSWHEPKARALETVGLA